MNNNNLLTKVNAIFTIINKFNLFIAKKPGYQFDTQVFILEISFETYFIELLVLALRYF